MASRRLAFCGLITAAIVAAMLVAGCGGGSSPASGTASADVASPAKPAESTQPTSNEGSGADRSAPEVEKKKHPPLQLPTGRPERTPSQAQLSHIPTADIEMQMPGKAPSGVGALPVNSTCDGQDLSPALEWRNVPTRSKELALFAMNLQPVNGSLYFDWAVAGIDPSVKGLDEAELPAGAIVGRNSAGKTEYSVCPEGNEGETYVFALYAVPKKHSPKQGFDPLALRKEVSKESPSVGIFTVGYTPR